jgi:hypothetical protein
VIMRLELGGRDSEGRLIDRASIVRWHKSEGDWVDYGDDLVDIEVEQVRAPERHGELRNWINELNQQPTRIAELAARQLESDPLAVPEIDPSSYVRWDLLEWTFLVRFTSSDRGVLRKISAGEGERREAGDLLAILATEPEEALDESRTALGEGSLFRVIENFLP